MEPLSPTAEALRALLDEDLSSGGSGLSQPELASRLGVDRATVSRALRQLSAAKEVKARRDHVAGQSYRVLVYQLTFLGKSRQQRPAPTLRGQLPPGGDLFVGRAAELAELRRGIAKGGAVVVDGVPGAGKTALVRRAVAGLSRSHLILWTTLQPGTTSGTLAEVLARAAGRPPAPGSTGWGSILPPSPPLTSSAVRAFLDRNPRGVAWVLDDAQAASEGTLDALREVLEAFRPGERHVVIVVTPRELPWPLPHGASAHLTLRGLSRKDAIVLTTSLGIPEERFEPLFRETLGMPRYLRLASRVGVGETGSFASAVLGSLPPHQRSSLLPLALSWGPLPLRSGLLPGVTPDEADALVSLSVLDSSGEGLQLPGPVARRLIETAPWEEVREAHRFLARAAVLSPAERFVHAVEAEEAALAFGLIAHHRSELIDASHGRVVDAALHLSHQLPEGRRRGMVLLLLAELQRVLGDFVAASTFLQRALEQLPRDDPAAVQAASMLSLTTLRAGHIDQAERWAATLSGLGRGHRWAAAVALAQGNVATYRGDFDRGERRLLEAERLARQHRQSEVRLMALHGLLFIAARRKEYSRSLDLTQEAMQLARRLRREDFRRILEVNSLQVLANLGRHEEAIVGYRRLLVECQAAGDRTRAVTTKLSLGREMGLAGDVLEAVRLTREAVREAEAAQDTSLVALGYSKLAWYLRKQGKLAEARPLAQRALRLSREVGPSPAWSEIQDVSSQLAAEDVPAGPPGERRGVDRLGMRISRGQAISPARRRLQKVLAPAR